MGSGEIILKKFLYHQLIYSIMQELKNKIYEFVKENGPVLPVQVAKHVSIDVIFASAILSELVKEKVIFVSNTKIGNSPVYYVNGQKEKLVFLYKYLNEKFKKAFEILKEKKIIRDSSCEPWLRVALRQIKDFAKPLSVRIGEKEELFWKWYLLPNEEIKPLIAKILGFKREEKKEKETKKDEKKDENKIKTKEKKEIKSDTFFINVESFLANNKIKILNQNWIRKNSEFEAIVEVPSSIGSLKYYLRVKKKRKINDADISLAFSDAQEKKLPIIFLSNGDLTNKAKFLIKERFKGLIFKKL